MHLLKVHTEDGVFSHVVVKVDWPTSFFSTGAVGRPSLFLDYLHHTAALWTQIPVASASIRVDVSPGGIVTSWHGITTVPDNADLLRRFAAALFRIDGVEGTVVSASGDATQFREVFATDAGSMRALRLPPRATSSGGEIFNPVRVLDRLNDLLAGALMLNHATRYQAVLRPCRVHPDYHRRVRKAEAYLARTPGVPPRLLDSQQLYSRRLLDAGYLVRETVSIDADGEKWLDRWLGELAQRPGVATPGWIDADIGRLDEDAEAAFAHHIHPDLLLGEAVPEVAEPDPASHFWTAADAGAAFRCEGLWRREGANGGPAPVSPLPAPFGAAPGGAGTAESPGRGAEPFFFVSYAHRDIDVIRPILDGVSRAGIRVWIDNQIAVGEEWDTRLERMITTSSGLLVFLSPSYVASKHCRRELKFADALDKDIFASALGEFPLEGGLGYIFASLQYARGQSDEIVRELCRRLSAGALH